MTSMRHLKLVALANFAGLLFCSCNPCNNLDCDADNDYGQFRIVGATNGEDLVFGPTKVYDKNQIVFYSVKGIDTTLFEYKNIKFPGANYDSILYIRFFPRADIAYMRLSNGDVDTLSISYNTFNTKCCGTITK